MVDGSAPVDLSDHEETIYDFVLDDFVNDLHAVASMAGITGYEVIGRRANSHLLTQSPKDTWSPESMTLEVTFACKTQADRERLKTALADW